MEPVETIPEGECSYLNFGMYSSSNEEANFMAQLLGDFSLQNDLPSDSSFEVPSSFWPRHDSTMDMAGPDNTDTNIYSCYGGGTSIFFPNSSQESYNPTTNFNQILVTNASDYCMQDTSSVSAEKEEPEISVSDPSAQDVFDNVLVNCKKRSCNLPNVQKNERNVKSKAASKSSNNTAIHRQSSSSYCSENDSSGSGELNMEMLSSLSSKEIVISGSNGKKRVGRGVATDPQSVYARKRREKINERLKILQNLIPNGTKVDISTMLEEAVQYVKFLQLQIKLLSSDDLWMYAPIAYNGMDVGLIGMARR